MANKYTPGGVATVGELEVGDLIFLRERHTVGLPVPSHAVIITELVPSVGGRVQVGVKNAGSGPSVASRTLGQLPATREFRRAIAV